jgi:hypothetical protein
MRFFEKEDDMTLSLKTKLRSLPGFQRGEGMFIDEQQLEAQF